MNLRSFRFQADENIDPQVTFELRAKGWEVATARDAGLLGKTDLVVLRAAFEAGRVVMTHDGDFGGHVIAGREPIVGILYLRPGHIDAAKTIASIAAVEDADLELTPPFIVVARRHAGAVSIRLRSL